MLRFIFCYAECHYAEYHAECRYAVCHYAVCRYAECISTPVTCVFNCLERQPVHKCSAHSVLLVACIGTIVNYAYKLLITLASGYKCSTHAISPIDSFVSYDHKSFITPASVYKCKTHGMSPLAWLVMVVSYHHKLLIHCALFTSAMSLVDCPAVVIGYDCKLFISSVCLQV